MRLHVVTVSFSLLLWHTVAAQGRRSSNEYLTQGTFKLGITQQEISKRLGTPPRGFGHYVRRTGSNEYALHLSYDLDDSESRLHPVMRLREVEIMIDRPRSLNALLADIPEAVELCTRGCALLGVVTDPNFNYAPHIIVYPSEPSAEQLKLAALLGTKWRPETAKAQWVPAVMLRWLTAYGTGFQSVDWLNQPIEKATFTAVAPSVESQRGTHEKPSKLTPDHPSVQIGVWSSR